MIVLKVLGWTVLCILGLVVLILLIPFAVSVQYDGDVRLKVGAAFFREHGLWLQILPKKSSKCPKKPKKAKEKPKKEKKQKKKKKPAVADGHTPKKAKKPLSQLLDELILPALRAVGKSMRPLTKTIRFRKLHAHLWVASDDAAKTGTQYGCICAALAEAVPLLYFIFTVDDCAIRVDADFTTEKLHVDADVVVSLTLGAVVCVVLRLGWLFLLGFLRAKRERRRREKNANK